MNIKIIDLWDVVMCSQVDMFVQNVGTVCLTTQVVSIYVASENQHKPWNIMVKNRNVIPDFPGGDAVTNFWLIGHGYVAAQWYQL